MIIVRDVFVVDVVSLGRECVALFVFDLFREHKLIFINKTDLYRFYPLRMPSANALLYLLNNIF